MDLHRKSKTHSPIKGSLIALSLSVLLSSLGISIVNVALPTLSETFGVSFKQIQWVVLAYLLTTTSLIVSSGRLADLIGFKKLLLIGLSLFTITSFLCSVTSSISLLVAFRALQGFGAAIMMALSLAFISRTVPKEKIGSAMGLLGTMSAIGTASGPALCGILVSWFSWRAIFLFNLPFCVLALVFATNYLPEDHPKQGKQNSFDWIGTLILSMTLTTYSLAATQSYFSYYAIGLFSLAGIGLLVFVQAETRIKSPLIQMELFQNRALNISLVVNVLVMTVMMATLIIGPFYLSHALEFAETTIGIIMSIGPIISILIGIPAGRIVDRFGGSFIIIAGLILLAIGSFVLTILPGSLGIAGYILAIVILTPGYQMFQAANNTLVMKNLPFGQTGVISGILNLSRNLGLISGASVMGAIFAKAIGSNDITSASPKDIVGGMQTTFLVAGVLIVLAIFTILFLGREHTESINLKKEE